MPTPSSTPARVSWCAHGKTVIAHRGGRIVATADTFAELAKKARDLGHRITTYERFPIDQEQAATRP